MSNVATLPEPRPQLLAGGRVQAIVPQSMDEAYRLAKAVCIAGMAPSGLDTPEKAMIAIMHGMEIGLTPMSALQRIAVVNGRPTIWGDAAIGLVRGSGLCEFVKEEVTGSGEAMAATCTAKRKGDPEAIVRTFSVDDAKKARLWGKAGPWQQYPSRMLQLRARAFALRDGFADVLGGLYLREEIDDAPQARDTATPPRAPSPPPAPKAIAAPVRDDDPPHDPDTGEIVDKLLPPAESAQLKKALLGKLAKCASTAEVEKFIHANAAGAATLQPADREELQSEWDARNAELYERENAPDDTGPLED